MDIEQLSAEHQNLTVEIQELSGEIERSRARRFLPVIIRKGKLKGELAYLTRAQYRKYAGKGPKPSIVNKKGVIPWELALDELATESGYRDGEALREAIVKLSSDTEKLAELKSKRAMVKSEVKSKETEPGKIDVIKLQGGAPVYPKNENTTAIVIEADGLTLEANRNPSFWQVKDNNPATPDARVRYSEDAQAVMREAAREHLKALKQRPRIRITPKRQKIRR